MNSLKTNQNKEPIKPKNRTTIILLLVISAVCLITNLIEITNSKNQTQNIQLIMNKQSLIKQLTAKQKQLQQIINLKSNQFQRLQDKLSSNFMEKYKQNFIIGQNQGVEEAMRNIKPITTLKEKDISKINEIKYNNNDPNFQIPSLNLQVYPPYQLYLGNLQKYYHQQKISKIAIISCDWKCQGRLIYRNPHLAPNHTVAYYSNIQQYTKLSQFQEEWLQFYVHSSGSLQMLQQVLNITDINMKNLQGITVLWKNLYFYKQINPQKFIQLLKKRQMYYQQMPSLNLRVPESQILFIFKKSNNNQYKKYKVQTKPIRNKIAVSTQLLFSQTLPFIREFIVYHLNLGIDKFFIFDNEGSLGNGYSTKNTSKHGMKRQCIRLNKETTIQTWNRIWQDFYDHIIYVPYQPVNQKGQITYAQVEQLLTYISVFQDVTKYTAYIDIDQFIVLPKQNSLLQLLQSKSENNCGCLKMNQQPFISRFCYYNKKIIEMDKYMPYNTAKWAPKNICENKYYIPYGSIHQGLLKQRKSICSMSKGNLKFHHYNLDTLSIEWATSNYKYKVQKIQTDNFLKKYKQDIQQACDNQCSDLYAAGCGIQQNNYFCPFQLNPSDYN